MSLDQGGPNALRKKLVDFFKGKVLTMNENLCLPNKYFSLNGCFMIRQEKEMFIVDVFSNYSSGEACEECGQPSERRVTHSYKL